MADHLGHGKNEPVENLAGNTRNGKSKKTLKSEFGELPIEVLADGRNSLGHCSLGRVDELYAKSRHREDMSNAVAHLPGADDHQHLGPVERQQTDGGAGARQHHAGELRP